MTELYFRPNTLPFHNIKIRSIEERHDAKYLGSWQYKDLEFPVEVFYIKEPTTVNGRLAERYVGVFIDRNYVECLPVDDIFDDLIVGVESNHGEVCVSQYVDHHRVSDDLSTWIEGGRDYLSTNRAEEDRLVRLRVYGDKFEFEPVGGVSIEEKPQSFTRFFQIFRWP